MESKWFRRPSTLPLAIAVMAMMIIIVGGTIRIYDAGESCPDWPQCFGTWGFDVSEEDQGKWYDETEEYDSRGKTRDTPPSRFLSSGLTEFWLASWQFLFWPIS